MSGKMVRHIRNFASEITRWMGFPKTSARIIEVLAVQGRKLSFTQLAVRVRISERSLRSHIRALVGCGVLVREVSVTSHRRLGYEYAIAPMGEILRMMRRELAKRIARLETLSDGMNLSRRAAGSAHQ